MNLEAYRPLWDKLDIDAARLTAMLEMAGKRHAEVFRSQANRPEGMAYFDNLWDNLQTGRIQELDDLKQRGKPLVGTFCIFVAEETVTAAGGACYGLCSGSPASIPEAEKELPRNICPMIKSAHGFKMLRVCGYTQSSDFIYGETTCEAKKKSWEILGQHHPVHVMHIPQKKDARSMRLWKEEVEDFNAHIERVVGHELSFDELRQGIEVINAKREALRRFDRLRGMHGDLVPISGRDAILVMQMSFIDEPRRFAAALHALCDELDGRVSTAVSVSPPGTPRLIILGTPFAAPNWKLHHIVETSGAVIINEESCIGHRYYKDDVDLDGANSKDDLVTRMMQRYEKIDCACFTPNQARIDKIVEMVRERAADGVVYYTLAFCHTYNVEAHLVATAMKKHGIPFLAMESDYSPEDAGQIKTRVEAFLESINLRKAIA